MADEINMKEEIVASGLDSTEVAELLEYVQGNSAEVPKSLEKLMTNIYQKMTVVAGYSVSNEVQRQAKLQKFLAKVEDEIMDESLLQTMSHEDLMELHARIANESARSQENTRKWLKENKDVFASKQTEVEKLAAQLSTLSPDKLESIKKILQGESLASTDDVLADL